MKVEILKHDIMVKNILPMGEFKVSNHCHQERVRPLVMFRAMVQCNAVSH